MKFIFCVIVLLSQAHTAIGMNWLFKKDKLADFKKHILKRMQENWEDHSYIEMAKMPIDQKAIKLAARLNLTQNNKPVNSAKALLSLMPRRYKLLADENERELFFIHFFNFRSNSKPLDKETRALFEMLNTTSEMLYEESDESRSRIDQLNIIKSELDNILLKLENNPTLLTWYCIKTSLRLKEKALLSQMRNQHAQDRIIYYHVDEIQKHPTQLSPEEKTKLIPVRVNSLKELREKSVSPEDDANHKDENIVSRPRLIKRTESQKIKDFLSTYIVDSHNNIISTRELHVLYPDLVITDTQKNEIAEINQQFIDAINSGKSAINALMDAFDCIKVKTGAIKKIKGHVRKIPSRVEWMTENKLKQFKEAADQKEALQKQYAQQIAQGKQPVHFKENPNAKK